MIIQNTRKHKQHFTLDKNGVLFVEHTYSPGYLDSEGRIKSFHLSDVERLLSAAVEDVGHVQVFDWMVVLRSYIS